MPEEATRTDQAKSTMAKRSLRVNGSQVLPTSQQTTWMQSTETHREVYQEVDQDTTEATTRKRNHEVDRMVIEADFDRRLPSQAASGSQCHLPMTTA